MLDAKEAYSNADFVVIATPANVYTKFSVGEKSNKNGLKTYTLRGYITIYKT